MADRLLEALLAERDDQPDKPEYQIGKAVNKPLTYIGVDRVSTNDQPGFETAKGALGKGRRYMVVFPDDLTVWAVAQLGAYLTDDEWDQAAEQREDEREMQEADDG